jgi:tetratricopeptide (TPR) repeat protein
MNKISFIVLSVLSLALVLLTAAAPARTSGIGEVKKLSGNVSYREKNNIPYKTASEGIVLEKGYWVMTGDDGWAELVLPDGSRMILSNSTEFEIADFVMNKNKREATLNILKGKLRATIAKPVGEKVNYTVKSPTGVVGVRGTEFMMMNQGFANVFFGNEGKAEISGSTEEKKPLSMDTVVQNTRGYVPTDPVDVKPDTPLYKAKKDFEAVTAAAPPKDWELSNNLPHIVARWNVNYGHYLADAGRYDEALYVFQIALDLTSMADIRSDARLERGAVYARFLRNPEAALSEYLLVLEEYPASAPQRETALYLTGMTLYEMGFAQQAKMRLSQYKSEYPSGRYLGNIETILNLLNK